MDRSRTNESLSPSRLFRSASVIILGALCTLFAGCGEEKVIIHEIIREPVEVPSPVELTFPPADTIISTNNPTFYWHLDGDAVRYQIQVCRLSDFINKSIDVRISDTSYTTISELYDGTNYWRVRAEDAESAWGDWSDAEIRILHVSYISEIPTPIELAFPPPDTFITTNNPTFFWHPVDAAVRYQLQVSGSTDFVNNNIDVQITDTTYTTISEIPNGTRFWRVRGENQDDRWGDWSDAEIRPFFKSDYVNYLDLISSINTVGMPQDVFVRGDTAYVADGQADLTIVDVISKNNPIIIWNVDTITDDFAKGIYVAPADTFPFVFVADMDAHVQVINYADTIFPEYASFGQQNIEDVHGMYISDTLYIFVARSKGVSPANFSYYRIIYDPFPTNITQIYSADLPADANGVFADAQYSYIAGGVAGIIIMDHSDINNPVQISSLDLTGSSLSIWVEGNYAYVAADRSGIFVVDVTDKNNPFIATQINTSGRTKDIQVIGDYAFIADGPRGLKVVDISVPDSAHFIANYDTPYAYGLWADTDYIYLCDRDEGLMIFENLSLR